MIKRGLSLAAFAVLLFAAPQSHASLETDCYFEGGYFSPTYIEADYFDETTCTPPPGSAFDPTGLPFGWEPFVDVLATREFLDIKRQECDGDAVWAIWRSGTSVTPRGTSNCRVTMDLIRQEANGSAVWARWAPGSVTRGSGDLQLNVRDAIDADFVPN